ncbi:uncharacterized protein LOC121623617 [Chelmon rostratus]|uniref:uncharacterized protein LOC121623617 n=1 Tax=Chelmon rostratus TaxID=109905 RepID=UPI001BE5F7B6|nr:uncharacterized protein LOC121623617 [Chelmon rostratus]XP_041816897.1 uncharacterized protein LOC121623617 [Chelmon rostratus]
MHRSLDRSYSTPPYPTWGVKEYKSCLKSRIRPPPETVETGDKVLPTTVHHDPDTGHSYASLQYKPSAEMSGKNESNYLKLFEKTMSADEKEKNERRKRVHGLSDSYSSTCPSSFRRRHDYEIWFPSTGLPPSTLPSILPRQQNERIISAQSEHHNVRLPDQQSLEGLNHPYNQLLDMWGPVDMSKTKGETVETGDKVLPSTTVHHDPETEHSFASLQYKPWPEMSGKNNSNYLTGVSLALQHKQDPQRVSGERVSLSGAHSFPIFSSSASTPFSAGNYYTDPSPQPFFQVSAPPFQSSLSYKPLKGNLRSFRRQKKRKIYSFTPASTIDSPQDQTREMELHASAGPSTCQLPTNDDNDTDSALHDSSGRVHSVSHTPSDWETQSCESGDTRFLSTPSLTLDQILHLPNRQNTDDGGRSFDKSSSTFRVPDSSQSIAPTVAGPPCPQGRPAVLQDSTVCAEASGAQNAFELLFLQSESESGDDGGALMEMETSATAVNNSVTLPVRSHLQISSDPGWSTQSCSRLPRSHSMPSLSPVNSLTRAKSLPDMLLKSSFEEFTPDVTADGHDETYRFQCSCPGLYQCSVTGLVFHMEGEGDVVYRIIPWNRRRLAQHHKQPAGPLFDIKCVQQSVSQLHLPHCEISSAGGCDFLSVAHENDDSVEFIAPHKITETHVIINITGFSGFGNVKDEDSPPDPVGALVLLFYRPPVDPELTSLLNVLLLPRNVVLRDVLRTRRKLVGDETYIETTSHCKLQPKQEYTLSTKVKSVLVEPKKAEFDCDNYDNYVPSFQVNFKKIMKHVKLLLREANSSCSVWERRVCLSSTGVMRSCGQSALNLPPNKKLFDVRSSFIEGISGPVLKSLLDKLLEKKVMSDSERESADDMLNRRDKARFVIDTVRQKGDAASSEMIEFLCEADPFLCEHLGLS